MDDQITHPLNIDAPQTVREIGIVLKNVIENERAHHSENTKRFDLIFRKLDELRDGYITRIEFNEHIKEYKDLAQDVEDLKGLGNKAVGYIGAASGILALLATAASIFLK